MANSVHELIAERDRLKTEVEELKTKFFSHPAVVEVHREREQLRAKVIRLQKERDADARAFAKELRSNADQIAQLTRERDEARELLGWDKIVAARKEQA